MNKIFIALLLFIMLATGSKAQNNTTLSCGVLNSILDDSKLITHFHFKNNPDDTLIIVDTFRLFNRSENCVHKGKQLLITDKVPDEVKKGDNSYKAFKNRPRFNVLVIESVKRSKKCYILKMWQAKDNAVAEFSVNVQKKTKIRVINTGVY